MADDLDKVFETFLGANPGTTIDEINLGGEPKKAIISPWNDSSLVLLIPEDPSPLAQALNSVQLPQRLSAIYHAESKHLEVIWTAYRLPKQISDITGRRFEFVHLGVSHVCEFRESSKNLMEIARAFQSVSPSETSYRNLSSFRIYSNFSSTSDLDETPFDVPKSFWISNADLKEDDLILLLSHLNFYLSYYDDFSPVCIIHPPANNERVAAKRVRFRHAGFPTVINSKQLEPEVLLFWMASHSGEPVDQFLHSYRIIEHAAFAYVDRETATTVRKVLLSPHALHDPYRSAEKVIHAVRGSSVQDYHKMEHVMCECVDAKMLWEIVEANIEAFSAEQLFDGGLQIKPLVKSVQSKDEFTNSGVRNVCNTARLIRNALSHGKESRSAAVIAPTKDNYERLRPWAALMRRAAGEVIVFNH